ncbi:hypothetical protein Btru_068887 [Bulinus truncatus]|nr:hypothetical protein Btru_068887 [Bulinus truncatus]
MMFVYTYSTHILKLCTAVQNFRFRIKMATSMPRKMKPKNRKTKTFLEFDEKARHEFLRGFHKRKIERKKQAREKQDQKILAERKELRKQVRDLKKNHLSQQLPLIPEIDSLVEPEIYDLPEHTVTIADIGDIDFVGKGGLRLGQNKGDTKESVRELSQDENTDKKVSVNYPNRSNKSLQQKLASCSNQLSSAKLKAKKMKRKHMLRQKFQAQKKGDKKKKNKK